jgi:hypothetical protein
MRTISTVFFLLGAGRGGCVVLIGDKFLRLLPQANFCRLCNRTRVKKHLVVVGSELRGIPLTEERK